MDWDAALAWDGHSSAASAQRPPASPRIDPTKPYLFGDGPPTVSTGLDLVPWPAIVWDANGYYRELGVSHRATKKELVEAYRSKHGQASARLTYILRQLLDPEIRRKYDATPMGSVFFDYYVETALRVERARWVGQQIAMGFRYDEAVERGEQEFQKVRREPEEAVLDDDLWGADNPRLSHPAATIAAWSFAYYLWRIGPTMGDQARMQQWQEALVAVFAERRERVEFAVGIQHRSMGAWGVVPVGYRIVAFLGEDEWPTEALAIAAASRIAELSERPAQWVTARGR